MTESCPRCGALVTYYASDIGETINCRSCNEPLRVTSDGLVRSGGGVGSIPAAKAAPAANPAPRSAGGGGNPGHNSGGGISGMFDSIGVLLGFLFLPGLFLTLLFLLLPINLRASVSAMEASKIELDLPTAKARQDMEREKDKKREEVRKKERELKYEREELDDKRSDLKRRRDNSKDAKELDELRKEEDGLNKLGDDLVKQENKLRDEKDKLESTLRKDFRKDLEKIEQDEREVQKKRDKLDLDRRGWEARVITYSHWSNWGLLFGLVVLMFGAVGYVSARQSMVRRIVGAITIAAVVLLIVAKMNAGRGVLLGMGGGGPKGLAAYNLATPRDALVAETDMILNNDLFALAALRDPDEHFLERELGYLREKRETLKVDKEARWKDLTLLFVSFAKENRTQYQVEGFQAVASGRWRVVPFINDTEVKDSDPQLAKEIRQWTDKNRPADKMLKDKSI